MTMLRGEPAKPKDIKAKWNKLDQFNEVMFTMACKWKNGKDVAGKAKEMLKDGEVEGADGYHAAVKDLQAGNVKGLQKACGLIIAEDKKACRQGCATRWNALAQKRDNCDEKCEKVYANFDRSCKSKSEGLAKVYQQKSAKAAAQKQCYEGHCKEFPQVWMKADEKAMNDEVKTQCKDRCTDENVKLGCQKKWALEVDFITANVASECAEKSGAKKCIDGKEADVDAAYDKCKSDTSKSCADDHKECTSKAKDQDKAFCNDRKKMCQDQADKKCLAENKAALNKAEAECKKETDEELTSCQDEKLKAKEEEAEKKCIAKRGPTCKDDCKGKCQVGKMKKCLTMLNTKDDPGKLFCKDFWDLLHASAELDPITGDPVA